MDSVNPKLRSKNMRDRVGEMPRVQGGRGCRWMHMPDRYYIVAIMVRYEIRKQDGSFAGSEGLGKTNVML